MTAVGKDAVLISYDFFNESLGHHQAIFTVQVNISKLVQPTPKADAAIRLKQLQKPLAIKH
jgi:hypothetical protein